MNAPDTVQLLTDLLHHLERIRDEGKPFDMGYWAESVTPDGQPLCGTSACVAGHAASVPSWRKRGYRLIRYSLGVYPAMGDDDDFSAFAKACGITVKEASRLCDPEKYPDSKNIPIEQPIARLKKLIAKYENANK